MLYVIGKTGLRSGSIDLDPGGDKPEDRERLHRKPAGAWPSRSSDEDWGWSVQMPTEDDAPVDVIAERIGARVAPAPSGDGVREDLEMTISIPAECSRTPFRDDYKHPRCPAYTVKSLRALGYRHGELRCVCTPRVPSDCPVCGAPAKNAKSIMREAMRAILSTGRLLRTPSGGYLAQA